MATIESIQSVPAGTHPFLGAGLPLTAFVTEPRPSRYPAAMRLDLQNALVQVDRASGLADVDEQQSRLITMASDWLAQTNRDLAHVTISDDMTSNARENLGDVLALLNGVISLQLQMGWRNTTPFENPTVGQRTSFTWERNGWQDVTPLRAATLLIERALGLLEAVAADK